MKRNHRKIGILLGIFVTMTSASCILPSCSDDEVVYYRVGNVAPDCISMGVVRDGRIETDRGNVLVPDDSSVGHDLTEGERVFIRGRIRDREDENTFRVRIEKYYQLLVKPYLRSSDSEEEELGDDPVDVENAWFGGGYLNARLALEHNASSGTSHRIELVYEDAASNADTARFTLRHNAYADTVRTRIGRATVSFDLENLLPEGQEKIYVVLQWRWYDRAGRLTTYEDSGYYDVSSSEDPDDGQTDEENISIH